MRVYRPMTSSVSVQRERRTFRAREHRLDEPSGLSLSMVASRSACFRSTWQNHNNSATSCRFSTFGLSVTPPDPDRPEPIREL